MRFAGSRTNDRVAVTWANLLNTMVMAYDTTHVYDLFSHVRLRRVEAWGAYTGSSSYSSIAIELGPDYEASSGIASSSKRKEDVTMSSASPAHVVLDIARSDTQFQWHMSKDTVAFYIDGRQAGNVPFVVDVHLSFTMNDDASANVSTVVSGATAGVVYFRPLDTTGYFQPLQFPTL